MKIQPDSRQIPKKREIVMSKQYTDIVYAWLQVNSERDIENNIRWIDKSMVNFKNMAEQIGLSRQTVSQRFKKLLDVDKNGNKGLGLVTYNEELRRYELPDLEPTTAMLVEKNTLREILTSLSEYSVSIYIYVLGRYLANGEKPFYLTIDQVKTFLGLSTCNRSNNHVVTDILSTLMRLGLIDFQLNTNAMGKSMYEIVSVSNQLPKLIVKTSNNN